MNNRERLVAELMRKYGLTRNEAEGFLDREKVRDFDPPTKDKSIQVDLATLGTLALTAFVFGLGLYELLRGVKRKSKKKEKPEEWLV